MTARSTERLRRLKIAAGAVLVVVTMTLVVLGAMPWGWFKPLAEARLRAATGRAVTIGTMERVDGFSYAPKVRLADIHIAQAAWARNEPLAEIRSLTIGFPVFPLLIGRFRPTGVDVSGVKLVLARRHDRQVNWAAPDRARDGGGHGLPLRNLTVSDMTVIYRDAFQNRSFTANVASGPNGFSVKGNGVVRGGPVAITLSAPAVGTGEARTWPFRAAIAGPELTMDATGTMDRPLDVRHMTLDVSARASDLKMIDAIIEAGLFGTQPLTMQAHARRDGTDWKIDGLHGKIGKSDISGSLTVGRQDGRTKLAGIVRSNGLDFDDLASNEGLARAAALAQREGLKIVPNTRINLRKITRTDGIIDFDIARVIGGKRPSSITSLKGRLTLDHQRLVVSPLRIGLKKGQIAGTATIDQHDGGPVPVVSLDLALSGSSIDALAGGDGNPIDAPLSGRARLTGPGSTIREAVGRSNGTIGLAAFNGHLPEKIAAMLGFDVARGLSAGEGERASLRCAVARFAVRNGRGTAGPLIIDTSVSQSHGTGTITFPGETLALTLTGAPKQSSALRLPGSVTLAGTIRAPRLIVPQEVKSVGNILKGVWRSISGRQGAQATDANCAALVSQATG